MKDPYENIPTLYRNFPDSDRFAFPEGIYRVTAGRGGECYLIDGGEKTALYDCGMAYCHERLISNIRLLLDELGKSRPDIVLMSHTHYDHIGALPYLIREWPDICVMGAEKAVSVFKSSTAKATMKRLGQTAATQYGDEKEREEEILVDGFRVDRILKEGDQVELGERTVKVYETPGHTDCSLTYHLLPDDVLFLCESVGLARGPEVMHAAILKDYRASVASALKCRAIGARHLVSSHFGIVPEYYSEQYYTDYLRVAREQYDMTRNMLAEGRGYDDILEEYKSRYWSDIRSNSQPLDAFMENARIIVKNLIRVVAEDENCQR